MKLMVTDSYNNMYITHTKDVGETTSNKDYSTLSVISIYASKVDNNNTTNTTNGGTNE